MVLIFGNWGFRQARNEDDNSRGRGGGGVGCSKFLKYCFLIVIILVTVLMLILNFVLNKDRASEVTMYRVQVENTYCLDGSLMSIYESKDDMSRILIYFDDSDLCLGSDEAEFLTSCTGVRDSQKDDQLIQEKLTYSGIFSQSSLLNQGMYNFSKIYVKSCDGSAFLGDKKIGDANDLMNMNGYGNMKQLMSHISYEFKITNTSKIVLAGRGSGAMTSLAWAPQFKSDFKTDDVYSIVENSILPGSQIFEDRLQFLHNYGDFEYNDLDFLTCTTTPANTCQDSFYQQLLYFNDNRKKNLVIENIYNRNSLKIALNTSISAAEVRAKNYSSEILDHYQANFDLLLQTNEEFNNIGIFACPKDEPLLLSDDNTQFLLEGQTITQILSDMLRKATTANIQSPTQSDFQNIDLQSEC